MKENFSKAQIQEEMDNAGIELGEEDSRAFRIWERTKIEPEQWKQNQYPNINSFWVVGILGRRSLYFNSVEGGWGWGCFKDWGNIHDYHWQQDEIQTVIHHTLFAIDNGGNG